MTGFKSSRPDPRRTGRASQKGSSSHGRPRLSRRVRSRSALKEIKDFPESNGRSVPAARSDQSARGKPSRRQRGRGKETERRERGKEKELPVYKQMFEDLLNEMEKDGIDCSWNDEESLTGHRPLSAELAIQDPDGTSVREESMVALHLSKVHAIPDGTLMLPSPRSSPGSARRTSSPSRSNGGSRRSSRSKETAPSEIEPRSSPSAVQSLSRRGGTPFCGEFAPLPFNANGNKRSGSSLRGRSRLFGRIRRVAGAVKTKCLPAGVHTYKLGEKARYEMNYKVPKSLLSCVDLETYTIEVEIVAVHIDAVLEMPYYTIKLPDETRKNTTGDNLLSLSEYEQVSKAAGHMEGIRRCSSSRSGSASRSRQRVRSSSRGRCRWPSLSRGKQSDSPTRGRSKSNSSTQSVRCANGDVIVPHTHYRPAGISPAPNAKKWRERSPSPFRRNLSCSKFLFFDEELNVNFFPVGESPISLQF